MRTATSDELAVLLTATERAEYFIVEVLNAASVWVNLRTLDGVDWVQEVTIDCERIDQPVSTASISLRREGPLGQSLATLMTLSPLNRISGSYAPLLDVGVDIRVSVCVVPRGELPSSSQYRPLFLGRIDRITWAADPIVLTCSDLGAWLMDTQIETILTYGSAEGTAVEDVMQELLNDNPSRIGIPALNITSSPGWALRPYQQERVKLLEALRALAQQIGWEVAYAWNASDQFLLTLFEVDREATTPLASIGPSQYLDIQAVNLSLDDIRNAVRVVYYDDTGAAQEATASDAASISKVGRRFIEIQEDQTSNIDTSTEASALVGAILSDLVAPPLTHEVTMPLFWVAEFADLYEFLPNGVHYDEAQDLAVVGVRHTLRPDDMGQTVLSCAGKPKGSYRKWLSQEIRRTQEIAWLDVTWIATSEEYVVSWQGAPQVQVSIDGGAFGTPSASPIVVPRSAPNGLDKTYVFRSVGDTGTTATHTVVVLAQPYIAPGGRSFSAWDVANGVTPGDGTGSVDVTWTLSGGVSGDTVDIVVTATSGDPITGGSDSVTGLAYTSGTWTASLPLGNNARVNVQLTARDSSSAIVATKSFNALVPF